LQSKVRLLASSALILATALGTAAHAQTKTAATAAAAAPAAESGATIEELVVTAEKRAQSLQDVPIAISAFTSERRDLVGINTIQDMTNFTPGLEYSSQLDRISLRGVGRLTNVQAADPGVATYSDGVYTSSTVEAGKTPLFVDRVEVLRGPQGTLYGRNSIGGAINVISKRPTEDPYAEVRASVGNFGHTTIEAAVSGPITDGLQFRIGGNWDKQRDGYYTNVVPGMPSEGGVVDTYYIEGQLQAKFGERLEAWAKLAISGWNNGGGGPGARATYTKGPLNTNEYLPGAIFVNPFYGCSGVPTGLTNLNPQGCTNPANSDPRKFAADTANSVSLDETYVFATQWTYHFDGADLKYIGGGTNYHYTLISDLDGSAIQGFTLPVAPFFGALGPAIGVAVTPCSVVPGCTGVNVRPRYASTYQEDKHWWSNELNLASSGNGPLQWLGGLYYYKEGYKQPVFTTLFDQTQLASPGIVAAVPAVTGPVAANNLLRPYDDRPQLHDESYAAFGQIDWKFATDWKLTAGLRYSHDHKYGDEAVRIVCYAVTSCLNAPGSTIVTPEGLGTFTPPVDVTAAVVNLKTLPKGVVPGGLAGVTFTPDGFAHRSYDANWDAWTGTAGVQWEPDHDTMAYARYSRGYKAGGFNVGISTTLGAFPYTGAEHANSYEVGLKKNIGRTFQANIALYYLDYEDFQAPLTIVDTSGGIAQSQGVFLNVPKAVSYGVELETTWAPIDHLNITLTYAYNDAHITDLSGVVDPADPTAQQPGAKPIGALTPCTSSNPAVPGGNALCDVYTGFVQRGQNLSGNQLPQSTKNKVALNVLYTWEFDQGSLSPSLSYIWRDKQYGSIFTRSYTESPSWDQVDARLTWRGKENKYTVIAFVKNLFDTLGYDGGATGARLAGTNIGASVASPQINRVLPGFDTTYPLTPPRTYGVEVQYRF
jgi:iron complex outermembrane receptor protein